MTIRNLGIALALGCTGCVSLGTLGSPRTAPEGVTQICLANHAVTAGVPGTRATLPSQDILLRHGVSNRWELALQLNGTAATAEMRLQAVRSDWFLLVLGAGFNYTAYQLEINDERASVNASLRSYAGLLRLSLGAEIWCFLPYLGVQVRGGYGTGRLIWNGEEKLSTPLPTDFGAGAGGGISFRLSDELSAGVEYQAGFRLVVPIRQLSVLITLGRLR